MLPLAWQFFTHSDSHTLISVVAFYYVEIHAEFPGRVAISKRGIVGGVVRDCDLVMKLKFFPGVFVGVSQKFMLMKIPLYRTRKLDAHLNISPMIMVSEAIVANYARDTFKCWYFDMTVTYRLV